MDLDRVKDFYEQEGVVFHYALAVNRVGLWKSEELLLTRLYQPEQKLLELGCGAGRIAVGLFELGYHNVLATDYSEEMVGMAQKISTERRMNIACEVADATDLPYEDESFDGAIFGFNGLMQIPHASQRMTALSEIARVIKPNGKFFFTTHDRENPKHKKHWKKDQKMWNRGQQHEDCDEFGDRIGETEWGDMYIHVPTKDDIVAQLEVSGFRLISVDKRSAIASEDQATREFSDDCLIWVAAKKDDALLD